MHFICRQEKYRASKDDIELVAPAEKLLHLRDDCLGVRLAQPVGGVRVAGLDGGDDRGVLIDEALRKLLLVGLVVEPQASNGKQLWHFMGVSAFSQYTVVADISICKVAFPLFFLIIYIYRLARKQLWRRSAFSAVVSLLDTALC